VWRHQVGTNSPKPRQALFQIAGATQFHEQTSGSWGPRTTANGRGTGPFCDRKGSETLLVRRNCAKSYFSYTPAECEACGGEEKVRGSEKADEHTIMIKFKDESAFGVGGVAELAEIELRCRHGVCATTRALRCTMMDARCQRGEDDGG
jgi:hypothetical protein